MTAGLHKHRHPIVMDESASPLARLMVLINSMSNDGPKEGDFDLLRRLHSLAGDEIDEWETEVAR